MDPKHKKILIVAGSGFIIILLIGMAFLQNHSQKETIKREEMFKGLAKIAIALEEYKTEKGQYPENLSLLIPDYLQSILKTPYTTRGDSYHFKQSYYYYLKNSSSYKIEFWIKSGWVPFRYFY